MITVKETKLTKNPVSVLTREVIDEKRIFLIWKAFNIALSEAGYDNLQVRFTNNLPISEGKPTDSDRISFDIWKIEKTVLEEKKDSEDDSVTW